MDGGEWVGEVLPPVPSDASAPAAMLSTSALMTNGKNVQVTAHRELQENWRPAALRFEHQIHLFAWSGERLDQEKTPQPTRQRILPELRDHHDRASWNCTSRRKA